MSNAIKNGENGFVKKYYLFNTHDAYMNFFFHSKIENKPQSITFAFNILKNRRLKSDGL